MQRTDYGRIGFVVLLLVVLYYVVRILQPFLPALVWAAILATAFHPFYARLARLLRRPRLASVLACVALTALIVLPVCVLVLMLAGESVHAYRVLEERLKSAGLDTLRSSGFYQWLLAKTKELGLPEPNLATAAVRALQAVSEFLVSRSASVLSGFASFVFNFFVMLLSIYYLFLYGPDLLRELRRLSPLRREHEEKIIQKFNAITVSSLGGSLLTALIQGGLGGLVFLIFGLPSPLLWGAAMAFLSLVPVVGTALVWGPLVVYYLLTGAVWKGIAMLLVFGGVVGSVDNVVKPLLIRRGVEINTLWVFLSIMGGVAVFGFLGLVLGPFCVAVLFALAEIYKVEFRQELGEKLSP